MTAALVCKQHTAAVQKLGTRCSFLYNCKTPWPVLCGEGKDILKQHSICVGSVDKGKVAFLVVLFFFLKKASQALSTGYSTLEALDFDCKPSFIIVQIMNF